MKLAAQGFSALSQETRLTLVRLLAAKSPAGMAAGDIATELEQAPSTLSFHLAALEQAGLITSVRQGRQVIYSARLDGLRGLFSFLTETCCGGRPDLCAEIVRLLPIDAKGDRGMTPAFNVLFLCTHNSARSIIAEAVLGKIGQGKFRTYSAGSDPVAEPIPAVVALLKRLGHDVEPLRSKSWDKFMRPNAPSMDFVITLCDTVQGQVCPDFGDKVVTAAWPFPDPTKFAGNVAERATLLGELYGMIRRRLEIFAALPFASLDQMALKARLDELSDSTHLYTSGT